MDERRITPELLAVERGWARRVAFLAAVAFGFAGCQPDSQVAVEQDWADARALWHIQRDPAAWRAWRGIDPSTHEGREARRLLAEAEPIYRRGIEEVRTDRPGARATFERAVRIAPMDPALYLPLARAFRIQGEEQPDNPHLYIRAAEYYRKFLVLVPDHPDAPEARRELAAIDPEGSRLFAPPRTDELREPVAAPAPAWPLAAALGALALALLALGLLALRGRRARLTLDELARSRPELHPAIAHLVASLRHELLKHRVGAVGDAVDALGRGRASGAELEFLAARLFEGEQLESAWEGHVAAFERALGPELDLRSKDRPFRDGARAIRAIARVEARVRRGEARAAQKLLRAHERLRELDRRLARMARRLVRTSVDGALFREVVDAVRTEYAAGRVRLDEVVIRAPEPAPMVEVFRVDLVLVLKNVVRNAILAVAQDEPPRRIGLDVTTEVEPTGEETVHVHVRDTSSQPLRTEDIYARRADRGLGLVTAALSRYDGTISVGEGGDGWAKRVELRFFRAFDDSDE